MGRRVVAIFMLVALVATGAALAAPAAPAADDPIAAEQARLVAAKRDAAAADARAARLDRQAAAEQDAAAKAAAQEAAVNAKIDKAQADIAAAQARIVLVQAQLDAERARLAQRQGPVVRLLAALGALARRPTVAAVAQPGSVDDLVHVRAVLGTVTPAIQQRTAGIRADLTQARTLRANAALAAQSLTDSRAALDRQQLALARLQATHRARSQAFSRAALAASDQALAMGEAARDAVDRMGELGSQAGVAAALDTLPDPTPRPLAPGQSADQVALAQWPPYDVPYRLPVAGTLVTGLGEVSSSGWRARGLTLATAADTPVIAPAAGRVLYARPFRDYGTVVIIAHGDGWTSLIAGLGVADVARDDHVAQGAEIGRSAAGDRPRVTVELRRRGRPVDMIPLLG
ncbi:MAG: murein hydrolase activator EnvC family protein [Sphingomonas sp.]